MGLFDGVPVNHAASGDDTPVTWLNLKELASKYSAEAPLVVEGTLEYRGTRTSKFKDLSTGELKVDDVLVIKQGDEKFGISGSSTMFKAEVAAADPQKGEPVAIRYSGKVEGKNGSYHFIEVMTSHKAERKAPGGQVTTEKIPF